MQYRMDDSGPRREREYDENSAELQWLEDSANDVSAATVQAAGGLCWALCAFVWYSVLFVITLTSAVVAAFKR